MNIGVDTAPAALVGAGAAPTLRESAAPGTGARDAAHFQSLVERGASASRSAAAKAPPSRDAARPKPAARTPTASTGTASHARTAGPVEHESDKATTHDPAAGTTVRATAHCGGSDDDATRALPAGTAGLADSELLAAMAAMSALPAPAPIALPTESGADEQSFDAPASGELVAGLTRQAANALDGQEGAIAPPAVPDAASAHATEGDPLFDPAAALVTAPQSAETPPAVRAESNQGPGKSPMGPAPSAAARAFARALGALTGDGQGRPAAASPEPATTVTGRPGTTRAERIDGIGEPAAAAAVPTAAAGARAATSQVTGAFALPERQDQGGQGDASVEGALRKASTAVQGRQIAAAAGPPATDVTAPRAAASAPVSDAGFRLEGLAVQGAQGGQQASIGLAPPVADPAAAREGTVAEQLVRAIRIQVRDGIGEAKLSLRPDHMGEVSVQLKVDKGSVSATLVVARADVRAQIEGQGSALRAGLEAQGLHLEELVVREDGERRKDQGQEARREQPRKRRPRPGDPLFDLDA